MAPARSRAADATVELQLPHAPVRERQLLAQPGVVLAQPLVVIQPRSQPCTDRRITGALCDRQPRELVVLLVTQLLDLLSQFWVGVEKLAADARSCRDR